MFSPAVSGAVTLTKTPHATSLNSPWDHSPVLRRYSLKNKIDVKEKVSFQKIMESVMYGIINSILTIPCMYGYAAIIFSHQDFATYMPILVKLVMFSSVVHQLMFTVLSSLPFSIGQVQDAGLIFISAIATSICNDLGDDVPIHSKIVTSVVIIGICTASLGAVLVTLGKLRLANLVSYLPMPVVGGYLAFIGLFCMFAGLSLCTGLVINDVLSLGQMWDVKNIILSLPGIIGGIFLLLISQRCEHFAALPGAILAMPLLFYLVLWICQISLEEARTYGWVGPISPPAEFSQVFSLYNFSEVYWSQLPSQFTTWVGMTFVVAFSSCLDVAAIEMDMGSQLNINHELKTVGWSNLVSGMLGGFTGSYIFSQTIFTYRTKTNSRIVGICVIISEFAICLIPVTVMSYVPRFFFAATLIFIAVDLMWEWLVLVWWKILPREYAVLVMSFIAINFVSLELGMLLGIAFAVINFLIGYSQVQVVHRVPRKSTAIRDYSKRNYLAMRRDAIVTLELHGYIFFGSSVKILEDLKKHVKVAPSSTTYGSYAIDMEGTSLTERGPLLRGDNRRRRSLMSLDGTPDYNPSSAATQYLVVDFKRVTGMDATAARSCFMILKRLCAIHNVMVVYTSILPQIENLLRNTDVIDDDSAHTRVFSHLDAGLEWCEDHLLSGGKRDVTIPGYLRPPASPFPDLKSILQVYVGKSALSVEFPEIENHFEKVLYGKGHAIYKAGEPSNSFYILQSGEVSLYLPSFDASNPSIGVVVEHVRPGAMFGEVDFHAEHERQLTAQVTRECIAYRLSKQSYMTMKQKHPEQWNILRDTMLKSMALCIDNYSWTAKE